MWLGRELNRAAALKREPNSVGTDGAAWVRRKPGAHRPVCADHIVPQIITHRSACRGTLRLVGARRSLNRRLGHLIIAAGVMGLVSALAGCTVPIDGVTGLRLSAGGKVSVVTNMCHHTVDEVTLYEANDATPDLSIVRGSWASSTRYQASWFIANSTTPGGKWSVEQAWNGTVPAGRTYTIYAGSSDDSWSTYPLDFTQRDIDRLQPDLILAPDVEFGGGRAAEQLVTEPEFAALACKAAE